MGFNSHMMLARTRYVSDRICESQSWMRSFFLVGEMGKSRLQWSCRKSGLSGAEAVIPDMLEFRHHEVEDNIQSFIATTTYA